MNPNSAHQRWSLWEYRVYPSQTHRPLYRDVKANCARFGRLMFGSASEMHVLCGRDEYGRLYWEIKVRSEGHPVHDPRYVEWMHGVWRQFFQNGFGQTCDVWPHARLEAGDREDGRPPDQLIIMPSVKFMEG